MGAPITGRRRQPCKIRGMGMFSRFRKAPPRCAPRALWRTPPWRRTSNYLSRRPMLASGTLISKRLPKRLRAVRLRSSAFAAAVVAPAAASRRLHRRSPEPRGNAAQTAPAGRKGDPVGNAREQRSAQRARPELEQRIDGARGEGGNDQKLSSTGFMSYPRFVSAVATRNVMTSPGTRVRTGTPP